MPNQTATNPSDWNPATPDSLLEVGRAGCDTIITLNDPTMAPGAAVREPAPIDQAIGYTADRLDRLEMTLVTLAERLIPVLGQHEAPTSATDRAGVRTTSTVGDRVAGFGHVADRLADQVGELLGRLEV